MTPRNNDREPSFPPRPARPCVRPRHTQRAARRSTPGHFATIVWLCAILGEAYWGAWVVIYRAKTVVGTISCAIADGCGYLSRSPSSPDAARPGEPLKTGASRSKGTFSVVLASSRMAQSQLIVARCRTSARACTLRALSGRAHSRIRPLCALTHVFRVASGTLEREG